MNRAHLVPQQTVDTNGRATTVHVNPNKPEATAKNSAALAKASAAPIPRPRLAPTPIREENATEGTGVAFENNWVAVDMVPSRFGPFTTIRQGHGGGGAATLIHRDGKILLVRQSRYATGLTMWELPRGGTSGDEDYASTAIREVFEETGEQASLEDLHSLGNLNPDTGILSTEVGLSFSSGSSSGERHGGEENEIDSVQWVDADEVVQACIDGTIQDSFTCVAVMRARLKGLI